MNDYDQAARYTIKLNPSGFLQWLAPGLPAGFQFREWLDTRTLPFPGEGDRTCDTVAALSLASTSGGTSSGGLNKRADWALVIECESEPRRDMINRLLEYLARLNRELNDGFPARQYSVAAALINLTGRGHGSQLEMLLPGTSGGSLRFEVVLKNVAQEDALEVLAAIRAGTIDRCILPLVPMMRGGGRQGIIREWKAVADMEPDGRLRTTFGGLTLVFAELPGRGRAWRRGLEGWNVYESPIINEWRDKGRVEEAQRTLLHLGTRRFGQPDAQIETTISETQSLPRLQQLLDRVLDASDWDGLLS